MGIESIQRYHIPVSCSLCERRAVEVVIYYFEYFLKKNFGILFLCEDHRKAFSKLNIHEKKDVLKGDMTLWDTEEK